MLSKLIKLSKYPFLIPFYHLVSDDVNTFAKYLYPPRKLEVFKKDLDLLLKYYTPVSLLEFQRLSISKAKADKPFFHLTFDDGLSNFHEVVAPILEEKKIPATVFVNTDFIDNKNLFYRYKVSLLIQYYESSNKLIKAKYHTFLKVNSKVKNRLLSLDYKDVEFIDLLAENVGYSFTEYLEKSKPYLTTNQIKNLIERGFTIGAHSKDHPLYRNISLGDQIKQTTESIQYLEDNFKLSYKAFSFPFNDLGVDNLFFDKTKSLLDISFGTSGIKRDELQTNFHRLSFEFADENLEKFLIKEYLKFFVKIPLQKNMMPRD